MSCLETDMDDGCPPGHHLCKSCSGSRRKVCKPCSGAAALARRQAAEVPENWAYCTPKATTPVVCVLMTAFGNDDTAAAAWFAAQGHAGRIRIVRVDDPALVTMVTP